MIIYVSCTSTEQLDQRSHIGMKTAVILSQNIYFPFGKLFNL